MNVCGKCHAPILWVRTTAGRPMPLDPDPVIGGNVLLEGGVASVLGKDAAADVALSGRPLHVSHFATCPEAAAFRREKRKSS